MEIVATGTKAVTLGKTETSHRLDHRVRSIWVGLKIRRRVYGRGIVVALRVIGRVGLSWTYRGRIRNGASDQDGRRVCSKAVLCRYDIRKQVQAASLRVFDDVGWQRNV